MTSGRSDLNAVRHRHKKLLPAQLPDRLPFSPGVHQARQSEASIREKQSVSVALAKRTGKRQPSMPKFNLKEE